MSGFPYETSVLAEVLDLADESTACNALGDYPIQVQGAFGGLVNDSLPLICGGRKENSDVSDCHIVGTSASSDPVAKLLAPRSFAGRVTIFGYL